MSPWSHVILRHMTDMIMIPNFEFFHEFFPLPPVMSHSVRLDRVSHAKNRAVKRFETITHRIFDFAAKFHQ